MYKALQDTIGLSTKLSSLTDFQFRVWSMGLAKSDTFGRIQADAKLFKAAAMPLSDVSESKVKTAIEAIERAGLIHLYELGGKRYMVFHDHEQAGTGNLRYRKSAFPAPPSSICRCVKTSQDEETGTAVTTAVPTAVTTADVHVHVPVLSPVHAKEGGVGGETPSAVLGELIDLWNYGKESKRWIKASEARLIKVGARLKDGFTREQLRAAIANIRQSEFHNGGNDRGWRAPGPEWVFHTRERTEQWVNWEPPKSSEEQLRDWARQEDARRAGNA